LSDRAKDDSKNTTNGFLNI